MALMNSGRPASVTATKGREPFVSTRAGSAEWTGSPADRNAAAIPSGPIRRSGAPNPTSTAAPAVTPAASAITRLVGGIALTTSSATPAANNMLQAARRQGWLSQADPATVTAAAPARMAGPADSVSASHEPRTAKTATASAPARTRPPVISQMTSPGWRYRDKPRNRSGFTVVPVFLRRGPAAARRPGAGVRRAGADAPAAAARRGSRPPRSAPAG